jgi:signal transduction histidine kinase
MHRLRTACRRRTQASRRLLTTQLGVGRGDVLLLAVLLLPSVFAAGLWTTPHAVWPAAATIAAAIVVRHRAPLLSMLLTVCLNLYYAWIGASVWLLFATALLSFLAGRRVTRLAPVQLVFAVVALAGLLLVGTVSEAKDWLSLLIVEFGASVLPWWMGNWWRQRGELARAGWERAEQLELQQRLIADQARLRERTQIAQDMHDSVGHELSVIALLAGGLEVAADLPERHRAGVVRLRERSTMATERLHEMVSLLRDNDPVALQPADESIADLVRRMQRSAVPMVFHEEGDGPALPSFADRAAYRVVQEALTNATKHAPGSAITVEVTYSARETIVVVRNGVASDGAKLPTVGSGSGLIGLDERVRLAGGDLQITRTADSFEVLARFPHDRPDIASRRNPPSGLFGPEPLAAHGAVPRGAGTSGSLLRRTEAGLRRRNWRIAAFPIVLGTCLAALMVGIYLYTVVNTSLSPGDFARMGIGQPRSDLKALLPARSISQPPPVLTQPAVPAGASCEYYRASGSILELTDTMYQLCFRDGALIAKDTLYNVASR